jgi:hypothetical protein
MTRDGVMNEFDKADKRFLEFYHRCGAALGHAAVSSIYLGGFYSGLNFYVFHRGAMINTPGAPTWVPFEVTDQQAKFNCTEDAFDYLVAMHVMDA